MAKTVSESIFNGEKLVIPMADVSHIEKYCDENKVLQSIRVITKHSVYNYKTKEYNNELCLFEDAERFLKAWCTYRRELEIDTLKDINPK